MIFFIDILGMGNCALYNGTNFATKGVVTVVVNYRLGAMGFLAAEVMKGNYGHMDQRLALQWTQREAEAASRCAVRYSSTRARYSSVVTWFGKP